METRQEFVHLMSDKVRVETVGGSEFLVAPVVALKPGVLNGELVTAEAIAKSLPLWNDVPLPVYHPKVRGQKVSAKNLDQIERVVIGRFYNTFIENDALKGELYIDIEKAEKLGGEALTILNRLRSGEPLEVSTGYFSGVTSEKGFHNNEMYNGVHFNIRPDHLALLPTQIGACSWADGCGSPRTHERSDNMSKSETGARSVLAKIKSLIGGTNMDREAMIQNLQDADPVFTAESLEKIDDNVLEWITNHVSEEVTEVEETPVTEEVEEEVVETETETETEDDVEITNELDVTVGEYLKTNGVDLEQVLKFMQDKKDAEIEERKQLIDSLIGNEKCGLSDETLGEMKTCVLKELANEYKPGSYLGTAVPCKPCAANTPPVAPSVILKTNKEGE